MEPLKIDREMVRVLYMSGVRPSEIARQVGCKASTIGAWATRGGWSKALRSMVQTTQQVQKLHNGTSNRLRDTLRDEASAQVSSLRKQPIKGAISLANTPAREGRASVLKKLVESVSMIDDWESTHRPGLVLCDMLGEDRSAGQVVDVQSSCVSDTPTGGSVAIEINAEAPQSTQVIDG